MLLVEGLQLGQKQGLHGLATSIFSSIQPPTIGFNNVDPYVTSPSREQTLTVHNENAAWSSVGSKQPLKHGVTGPIAHIHTTSTWQAWHSSLYPIPPPMRERHAPLGCLPISQRPETCAIGGDVSDVHHEVRDPHAFVFPHYLILGMEYLVSVHRNEVRILDPRVARRAMVRVTSYPCSNILTFLCCCSRDTSAIPSAQLRDKNKV